MVGPIPEIVLRIILNIFVASLLVWLVYYKRYRNKQMAVSMMMMNIAIFSVMGIITTQNFALQAGLGLFAILSIFRFRSKNFEQMDITYFFCAVAIAVINSAATFAGGWFAPIYITNALVLIAAYLIDFEGTLGRLHATEIRLDYIPDYLFDEQKARAELSKAFGVDINRITIKEIDYIKETAKVDLYFVGDKAHARIPKTGLQMQGKHHA